MKPIDPLFTSSFFDSSKIPCKLHPAENIINFCKNQQCLTGLCASCICTHTEIHVKNSTIPKYESIKSVHTETLKQVTDLLKGFDQDKQRINDLIKKANNRKRQNHQVLQNAKREVYEVVDKYFQRVQNKLDADVENEIKNTNLQSVYNLQILSKRISKQMRDLLDDSQEMSTMMKFVQGIKRAKTEIIPESNAFKKLISQQIADNEEFRAELKYSKDYIQDIGNVIQKLFSLEFHYPKLNGNKQSWLKQTGQRQMRPSSSVGNLSINLSNARPSCNANSSIVISNASKLNRSQSIKINQPMISSLIFTPSQPQRFLTECNNADSIIANRTSHLRNMPTILSMNSSTVSTVNGDIKPHNFIEGNESFAILPNHQRVSSVLSNSTSNYTSLATSRIQQVNQNRTPLYERFIQNNRGNAMGQSGMKNRISKVSGIRLSNTWKQNGLRK